MERSSRWVRSGGIVVALVGFATTRLFVAETVRVDATLAFVFAGLLPLSIGLAVTAYGVALAVGTFSREYTAAVARWCLIGTLAMGAVLLVTSLESLLRGEGFRILGESPLLVANVLLGGVVGGLLIGKRSATNRRQERHIRRQANRALLLDRLLRHEVINAVTIILGQTDLLDNAEDDAEAGAIATIRRSSRRIETTIDDVGELIEERDPGRADVAATLRAAVDDARSRFPDLEIDVDGPAEGVDAVADDRLRIVFRELLANAGEDGNISRVEASVTATDAEARVSISDDGAGLAERHRELLASGAFPEYDDPGAGFGLQIVRLLVLQYDGRIAVDEGIDGEGTTITVVLPRDDVDGDLTRAVNVSPSNLCWAAAAGLVAGVAMGAFFVLRTDLLPVIGALYGVPNPIVGWATHLFHSVIFAFVFAAGSSSSALEAYTAGPLRGGIAGVAWGTTLWLVAAGVIMPLWLQGVGIMAMLPNLSPVGFVSHAIWGSVLGVSYAVLKDRDLPYCAGDRAGRP